MWAIGRIEPSARNLQPSRVQCTSIAVWFLASKGMWPGPIFTNMWTCVMLRSFGSGLSGLGCGICFWQKDIGRCWVMYFVVLSVTLLAMLYFSYMQKQGMDSEFDTDVALIMPQRIVLDSRAYVLVSEVPSRCYDGQPHYCAPCAQFHAAIVAIACRRGFAISCC